MKFLFIDTCKPAGKLFSVLVKNIVQFYFNISVEIAGDFDTSFVSIITSNR
jgi:hypothetical protein